MLIMNMFCPIKANKNRKIHPPQRNGDVNQTNINITATNNENQLVTSMPYRYVTKEFHAEAADELTVLPGDVVLYEFSDSSSNGNWSHVTLFKAPNKSGFVPSDILTTDPKRYPQSKKKLPRSITDHPLDNHPHHHHPNRYLQHNSQQQDLHRSHHRTIDQTPQSDTHIKYQHQQVHEPGARFGIPHSTQSSSGKQSLPKYPDLRHFTSPAHNNVCSNDPHYEHYELKCTPFHRDNFGLYMVTYNFVAREENDLSVRPGDYVSVLNKDDEDWYWIRRECDLAEGFVPSRFICDYEQVKSILNKGNSTVTMKSSNHNDYHTYINHRPDRESLATDQQSSVFQHS